MELLELLLLALAPVLFIMIYLYVRDEYDREPLIHLLIAFILGILATFPVVYVAEQLKTLFQVDTGSDILGIAVYAFVVVAFTEEGMKYLVLRNHAYRLKAFDEPYDGIMYGATVSLGFAAIENVLYVYNGGYEVAIMRMFTAVPAHAAFGILMGYYVGNAKFMTKGSPQVERLLGLGIAILFHGLYDFFLFIPEEYIYILAFITLLIAIRLSKRAIKIHKANSPHKPTL